MSVTLSFVTSNEMNEELERVKEQLGITKSSVIKMAISEYLNKRQALEFVKGGNLNQMLEKMEEINQNLVKYEKDDK